MYQFLPNALTLLQKYKSLLKKQLPESASKKVLSKLQLHQRLPREEANLYHLMMDVIQHLQTEITTKAENARFSGTAQLLQDMQDFLQWYHVVEDRLVHASQEASRAMLHAIQLMVLPGASRTKKVAMQLKDYAMKVARYGKPEQKALFKNSLEKHAAEDASFFLPIMTKYQEHFNEYQ